MNTAIEWTDATWNPVRGCERISPGCVNCYAERTAMRFSGKGQPYEWLVQITNGHPRWTGKISCIPEKLKEPLGWKQPRRVFVNSMSDLFHDGVPEEFINRVFAVMALACRHTFQVLTKRPDRMLREMMRLAKNIKPLEEAARELGYTFKFQDHSLLPWPIPNVWLGVSVESQKYADERIPLLLQTPAAIRFLSVEPLLESVDIRRYLRCTECGGDGFQDYGVPCFCGGERGVDLVICGGESGPGARPFN